MKNIYLLFASLFVVFSVPSIAMTNHHEIKTEIKAGVAISVAVKSSEGKPIKGALIKIISNKMVIAAGSTDEGGNAALKISSYGNQAVDIEVSHALFRPANLNSVTLENNKVFNISLEAKGVTEEQIKSESEQAVEELQKRKKKK